MSVAATSSKIHDQNLLGMLVLSAGIAVFSLQDVIFKLVSPDTSIAEAVFIRSLVALPLGLALVAFESGLRGLATPRPGFMLLRSALMFVAYLSFYLAIAAMPIAEAVAIALSAPLFISLLSVLILGNQIGPRRLAAIVVGFIGALVLIRPGTAVFEPAALLAVLCALSYASAQILTRQLGAIHSSSVMAFHAACFYFIASAVLGVALGDGRLDHSDHPALGYLLRAWSWPDAEMLTLLATTGVIATIGFYCLAQAYRIAEPNVISSFEYTSLLWGLLWGYVFWKQWPDTIDGIGIALIAGAGLYLVYREAVVARRLRIPPGP